MKKVLRVCVVVALALALVLTMTACGGVAGTYKLSKATTATAEKNGVHPGYISHMAEDRGFEQHNELVLNKDGTYQLTKTLKSTLEPEDTQPINYTMVFTGTYTAEKNVVTLAQATTAVCTPDWGNIASYFSNPEDSACDQTTYPDLVYFFTGLYFPAEADRVAEDVIVTVNAEDGSFAYN